MVKSILSIATGLLVIGYLIHAVNFYIIHAPKMCTAMVLFAAAMYFLFV